MEHEEYSKMAQMQGDHWWYLGRRFLIRNILCRFVLTDQKPRILDVGCGAGEGMAIAGDVAMLTGIDASEAAALLSKNKGYESVHHGFAEALPFADDSFDGALMLDVLEHIEEDVRALTEAVRILKKDGFLMITVPAYQWLWSRHDQALGHKRRYTKAVLVDLLERRGFDVQFASYYSAVLFPFFALYRLIFSKRRGLLVSDTMSFPVHISTALFAVYKLESWWFNRGLTLPFGSSIIIIARVP